MILITAYMQTVIRIFQRKPALFMHGSGTMRRSNRTQNTHMQLPFCYAYFCNYDISGNSVILA